MISLTPAQVDELADVIASRLEAKMADAPALIDRRHLAKKLGVSTATVERFVRVGRIPVVRIGSRTLFDLAAVLLALRTEKGGDA